MNLAAHETEMRKAEKAEKWWHGFMCGLISGFALIIGAMAFWPAYTYVAPMIDPVIDFLGNHWRGIAAVLVVVWVVIVGFLRLPARLSQ